MGTIKDKNSKDIAEAEEINKSWQEYPEELYKIGLKDPDNHSGCRHPAILECEVQWALGSITTNEVSWGGIPAELFQILKDDPVKVLQSIC